MGETSTSIMKWMQGHVDMIERKVLSDGIGRHFNTDVHQGKKYLEIYILEFIFCDTNAEFANCFLGTIRDCLAHKVKL